MIWFAGLKTMGQKSGSISQAGSHTPVFCVTKRGSSSLLTHSSLRLMVMTPIEDLAPMISLSSPGISTLQSQGMFRMAKNRTSDPKMRCARRWLRPWAKMVPIAVRFTSMYGRMFSKISLVVLTGPVQRTMSDSGISSAGSSETLCNRPTWTSPLGKRTLGRFLSQTSGRLVSSCVRTRPFVFSSKSAAQTWPLLPEAMRVTTI
mmetsp:Transcript_14198/g.42296  ORF Transcript_14198/g.42296 Transcript_14198/m.42296 type:complete len:204 (-) Transcript_14198:190-801(-)